MGKGNTGGKVAAPIFGAFMKEALADQPPAPFRIPPGLMLARVNLRTGLRAVSELVPDAEISLLLNVPDEPRIGWSVQLSGGALDAAVPVPSTPTCSTRQSGPGSPATTPTPCSPRSPRPMRRWPRSTTSQTSCATRNTRRWSRSSPSTIPTAARPVR